MLTRIKQNWNRLALLSTCLMTFFSGFLLPPPAGAGDKWFQVGRFAVALLAGLWFLPLRRFGARAHAWAWWGAGLVFAAGGFAVFLQYDARLDDWTVPYWKTRAVVGRTLTPDAAKFRADQAAAGTPLNNVVLLKYYGGDSSAVWLESEIVERQRALSLWYVATLLALASAVIAICQAIYCATARPARPGGRKSGLAGAAPALLLLLALQQPAAAQTVRPGSDAAYFRMSKQDLIASLGLRAPRPSDPLEKEIREESKSLDSLAGFATEVWVGRDCGISSHPDLGVIVDLSRIEAIRNDSRVRQPLRVLRWLLAHEKVHQLQYRAYSAAIAQAPDAERQAYEAQADLLAGKYLLESIEAAASRQDNETILDALRAAYELGAEQYALADHPSHESRLTAVRLGMAAGMLTKMQQLGGGPALGSAATLIDKLNILPGEDVLGWSLRTARRIVNHSRPAIVDLVLAAEDVVVSKDPAQPVASYWLTYENRGRSLLHVDMEVQCVAASPDDPEDVFRWQKISVRNYVIDIAPMGKNKVSGSLRCDWEGAFVPRVIAPPLPTALIRVEATGGPSSPADRAPRPLEAGSAGDRQSFESVTNRVVRHAFTGFRDLRAGPGRKTGGFVAYPSEANFPGALRTEVWLPEPNEAAPPFVLATLVRGAAPAASAKVFEQTASALRATFAPGSGWSRVEPDPPGAVKFVRGAIEASVERKRRGAAGYDVVLTVRKNGI